MIPRLADAKDDPALKDSALRVYLHLVYDLSPVEWREMKNVALARRLNLSERTVEYAMSTLIHRGYIEAEKRMPGSPQTYRLIWSAKAA